LSLLSSQLQASQIETLLILQILHPTLVFTDFTIMDPKWVWLDDAAWFRYEPMGVTTSIRSVLEHRLQFWKSLHKIMNHEGLIESAPGSNIGPPISGRVPTLDFSSMT
jgi:hypothetical protein